VLLPRPEKGYKINQEAEDGIIDEGTNQGTDKRTEYEDNG